MHICIVLYLLIPLIAFLASGLTLFSGFGLGTLLLPAFAWYFPADLSIALTAIVHLLNNLFKLGLVGRFADRQVVFRFGLPALFAALAGAALLRYFESVPVLYSWSAGERQFSVSLTGLLIGILLIVFSFIELIPTLSRLSADRKYLSLGGLLSGFFGGISGMQGALRSIFLLRTGLSKEAFIGTGVVIACLVDVARLALYTQRFISEEAPIDWALVSLATLSAFLGAWLGNRYLKKTTLRGIQVLVGVLLVLFGAGMMAGLIQG